MSQFYDQSSLVFLPSGYKDGKLYSQKPLSTSGELAFSRGSDIEATRVNSQGYIEKAKVNLLLQSNSFDTTWTNSNTTETGGQAGYDGTNDAWKLDKSAAGGYITQLITLNAMQSFSVYAKAGTSNWVVFLVTGYTAYFDLANGTVGAAGSAPITNIQSVGGGWYRCTLTASANTTSVRIYPAEGDGDTSGTSGNIYIQDAQLNYGLVAQEYQETTTAAVVTGITNDMPRLSYDPANPTCPSLLLEPSRTNLINQSDYIESWSGANTTVASNAGTSPEGVNNATSLTFASGGYWYKSITIAYTAGTAYTWSIYANTSAQVIKWGGATPAGTDTYTIEDAGNGWYRQIITRVVSGSGTTNFQPLMDWVNVGVGVEFKVYGAQFEASASYASSLIPTYGTSATRTADLALKTSASAIIGQTEGTLFFEIDNANFDASNGAQLFSLDNGTSLDRIEIYAAGAGAAAGKIGVYVQRGSAQVAQTTSVNVQGHHKIALAYKLNDYALYIDGALQHSDTSALVPACNNVRLQGRYDNLMTGKHSNKQALLFTQRLSNSDLANLTTL